jgi:hypothetical protein
MMRWAGQIACMAEMREIDIFLLENVKGRDRLERLGVDGKIILEWILARVWTVFIWLRIGTSGVFL